MLDIGWTELLVIAVVLIVVVGPKDLPPMLRAFGKMTANLRKMAGDFRTQFDQALREADMDDVRQTISDAQRFHPANAIREAINPLREMGNEIRNDLQKATTMPPLTGSDSKADDGETSAASLEDLLPMPELSLPESPPPSVAATPAVVSVVCADTRTDAPRQHAVNVRRGTRCRRRGWAGHCLAGGSRFGDAIVSGGYGPCRSGTWLGTCRGKEAAGTAKAKTCR